MPIELFRAGRHVATSGEAYTFTEADVRAMVAAYDPAKHEAPVVVGHPKGDAPAYAWVKSLAVSGDGLVSYEEHQADPQFVEMRAAGRFKKRSASLYAPDSPANPVPGVYYLRHVGWLGAQPPAVKGLKDAAFAEHDGVIEFADWGDTVTAQLFRRMREFLIANFGLEKADQAIPDYQVAALEEAARTEDSAPAAMPVSYQEAPAVTTPATDEKKPDPLAEIAARAAALDAREAEFAEREARIAAAERAARDAEITRFVDGLVAEARVLPKDRLALVAFMGELQADLEIEFGEGDKRQKPKAAEWLRTFLSGLPKQVELGEVAAEDGAALPDGASADDIAKRAREFQEAERKAGREIRIADAVTHVTSKQ